MFLVGVTLPLCLLNWSLTVTTADTIEAEISAKKNAQEGCR